MHHLFSLNAKQQQHVGLSLLVVTAILLTASLTAFPSTPAQAQTGGWQDTGAIASSGSNLITPDVAVDANGVSHVVYTETNFEGLHSIYYVNNRSGSWGTPTRVSSVFNQSNLVDPAIATNTINGNIHIGIIYGAAASGLFYVQSTNGGINWSREFGSSSSHKVSNDDSGEPDIVIDHQGVAHVVHRGFNDGNFFIAYRNSSNWGNRVTLGEGDDLHKEPTINYTVQNNTLSLFAFYAVWPPDQNDYAVYYSRKVGTGGWTNTSIATRIAQRPSIATNGSSTLYLVITRKQSPYDIEPFFYRSTNNGASWSSGQTPVGAATGDLSRAGVIAFSPNNTLAVVSSDDYNASDARQNIFARISTDGGASWQPSQSTKGGDTIFADTGSISANPNIDGSPSKFQVVWNDNTGQFAGSGRFRILASAYPLGPPPPTPTPTNTPTPTPEPRPRMAMSLLGKPDGNDEITRQQAVDVRFTITSGTANSYRLSNDAVNWSPYQPLPADNVAQNWTIAEASSDACEFRTVYGQVRDEARPELPSEVGDASIQYDPDVDATVIIRNPNLTGNEPIAVQDFAANGNGASDGAPNYTRSNFYYAEVTANPGECSLIREVNFSQLLEPTAVARNEEASVTVSPEGGTVQQMVPFAEFDISDGTKTVEVEVMDGSEHVKTYRETIIRDTVAPQVLSDTVELQLLSQTGSFSDTDSVIVRLNVGGLQVNDNLYGQAVNEDKPFWGIWAANSRDFIPITDTTTLDETLDWKPVEISNATSTANGYEFSTSWSLMKGIADEDLTAGDYYVYVRVLDGAGNPSDYTMISNPIELKPDFTTPEMYLPSATK